MSAPREPVHALLLAAGGSRRLGRPKQLVCPPGQTISLVRRAALQALVPEVLAVTVAVRPHDDAVVDELAGLPVAFVPVPRWAEGMASSLRAGVAAIPRSRAVLVFLCDQLAVSAEHVTALACAYARGAAPIVASAYAGTVGVPAVFASSVRGELETLTGDAGARSVVRRDPARVHVVALPGGERDVDLASDLERRDVPSPGAP